MKKVLLTFAISTLISMTACSGANPIEIGKVKWERDLEVAQAASKSSGKPIFALFQEVPGCAGCQQFGREVLSEKLMVKAIQSEFIPVVVFNNQPGKDAQTLKRFGEPAWNYQVVRFLNAETIDIIPRKDRVWTLKALAARMGDALKKAKRPVPDYLQNMAKNGAQSQTVTAAFAMFCYWTGEMKLGQINGVQTTEAGWLDGREVTLVSYDPEVISFPTLVTAAEKVDCAHKVFVSSDEQRELLKSTRLKVGALDSTYRKAKGSDQKRQLQGTPFAKLKLSPEQATKVNAWARVDHAKSA